MAHGAILRNFIMSPHQPRLGKGGRTTGQQAMAIQTDRWGCVNFRFACPSSILNVDAEGTMTRFARKPLMFGGFHLLVQCLVTRGTGIVATIKIGLLREFLKGVGSIPDVVIPA
jgi:hypothetical protein